MELSEAMRRIGELETKLEPLEAERDRLKQHNDRLLGNIAKSNQRAEDAENARDDFKTKVPGEDDRVLSKEEAAELDAYRALELKPDEVKTKVSDYNSIRAELTKTNNRAALAKLGIKPVALHMRQFDGVELVTEGEGDKLKAKVKAGDTEQDWGAWVKAQGLESDMSDLTETVKTPKYTGPGNPGAVPKDPTKQTRDTSFGI